MKLLYSCLLIAFASCGTKQETITEEKADTVVTQVTLSEAQLKNAGISIGRADIKTMNHTLKASGVVDVPPQNLVSVSFPMGGYLKTTSILPGTNVGKGQVIAIMEDQAYVQLQQEYLMAKTRMEFLSADVKRQKDLSEAEATSLKQYQQVLSDFRTQQVLIRSLEEKLKTIGINPQRLTIANISRTVPLRSPINGFVSKVNVNIGKYVNPSDVLFELVNPDDIHAAINIFEKDLSLIKKGLRGTVSLGDNTEKKYNVEVLLVTRSIDETRTGVVHCHFENKSHDLLPGMYLSATFNIDNKQVYALPEEAIVRYAGKHYVFLARSANNFFMKEVGIGITQNGYTEMMSDPELKWQNTSVVMTGAYALLGKLKNTSDD